MAVYLLVQGILDLCHQPTFIRDVYLNLDCRWVQRTNQSRLLFYLELLMSGGPPEGAIPVPKAAC